MLEPLFKACKFWLKKYDPLCIFNAEKVVPTTAVFPYSLNKQKKMMTLIKSF